MSQNTAIGWKNNEHKYFCNFCEAEITKEKTLGKLITAQEKQQFSLTQTGNLPQDFKNVIERQDYDLCQDCLKKVFKALEKDE